VAQSEQAALKQQMKQALEMLVTASESGKINGRDVSELMKQMPAIPGMSKEAALAQLRAMTPAQREALVDQIVALMSGEKPKGVQGFLLQQMMRWRGHAKRAT